MAKVCLYSDNRSFISERLKAEYTAVWNVVVRRLFCGFLFFLNLFSLFFDGFFFACRSQLFKAFKVFVNRSRFFGCDGIYINRHTVESDVFLCDCVKKCVLAPHSFGFFCAVLNEQTYFSVFFGILVKPYPFDVWLRDKLAENALQILFEQRFDFFLRVPLAVDVE